MEDANDLVRGRARPGVRNWLAFCERTGADGAVAYDNYSTGTVEWALNATPGVWARVEGRGTSGGEAGAGWLGYGLPFFDGKIR